MSDKRPYGDDPSRYPYPPEYFNNPSSSSDYSNDPGMSSGYNNAYFGTSTTFDSNSYPGNPCWGSAYPNQPIPTFDNNSYSGNPCWESAYPNQSIPTFDNNSYQPTAYVDPHSSVPNLFMATSDHNCYLGNTSGYPPQSDPCSNDEVTTVHRFGAEHQNDSTNSDTYSDDSVDSSNLHVRSFGLRRCSKKKPKNKEHDRWIASWKKDTQPPPRIF